MYPGGGPGLQNWHDEITDAEVMGKQKFCLWGMLLLMIAYHDSKALL